MNHYFSKKKFFFQKSEHRKKQFFFVKKKGVVKYHERGRFGFLQNKFQSFLSYIDIKLRVQKHKKKKNFPNYWVSWFKIMPEYNVIKF